MTYAACFLCKFADESIVKFAEEVATHMPTCMICDLEPSGKQVSATVPLIHVAADEVARAGFQKVNEVPWLGEKSCMALDKALFHFATVSDADYVWLIEEDTFIPRPDLLAELDRKYPIADLITRSHTARDQDPTWGGWVRDDLTLLPPPHAKSMSCCIRVSRALLEAVRDFAGSTGRLVFMEYLFNSLAAKQGLLVFTPPELTGIEFRQTFSADSFHPDRLLHPIKQTSVHPLLRKFIDFRGLIEQIAPALGQ